MTTRFPKLPNVHDIKHVMPFSAVQLSRTGKNMYLVCMILHSPLLTEIYGETPPQPQCGVEPDGTLAIWWEGPDNWPIVIRVDAPYWRMRTKW